MLHKFIKKVGPELHIFLNATVLLVCLALVAAVVVLVFKHERLKSAMYFFANNAAIASKQKYVGADATEDAQMFATTIANVPAEKVLFDDKANLQRAVALLSRQTGRAIVVMNISEVIVADSIAGNVGKTYAYGHGMDVATMRDGQPRRFTEESVDYPSGVDEVVVPVKDATGKIVGAVVMSTSHIFND